MPTRTLWRLGFSAHFSAIILVSIVAYAGALPRWLGLVPHADKVLHFLGAGVLALLLDGALGFRGLVSGDARFPPLGSTLVLTLLGVEEILQGFSVHRTSSVLDFAADALGVTVAYLVSSRLRQPLEPAK